MKKLFGWCAAVALAGTCLAGQNAAAVIRAGMGRVDITPPWGAFIPGYFSPRLATGASTPLTAECVAFSDGTRLALVYTVDNLHLTNTLIPDFHSR